MGILDDAIREHLELKRKHGAADDEVQILEKEAFGPPSRPGEPDFPERPPTGEEALVEEGALPAEEALAEDAAVEAEEPPELAEPVDEGSAGLFDHAGEESPVGQPTEEHGPPPPEDVAEPDEAPAAESLTEPAESAESAAAPSDSGELEIGELELELDEEFEEFRETEGEPSGEAEPRAPVSDETDERAAVELDRAEEDEHEDVAAPDEGEDVLEETPEFLRDTPEDERLWFEQGEPQDFDFDEEEEDSEER